MTQRLPNMPAPFISINNNNKVKPNPRTVRGSDMTWFNTSGNYIIRNDYNTCNSDQTMQKYPWGGLTEPSYQPFNLKPWGSKMIKGNRCDIIPRFDLYGHSFKCLSTLNKCGCDGQGNKRCPIYDGAYFDPN